MIRCMSSVSEVEVGQSEVESWSEVGGWGGQITRRKCPLAEFLPCGYIRNPISDPAKIIKD